MILITRSHWLLVCITINCRVIFTHNTPLVDTLINRYIESESMVEETQNYYDKMTSTIEAADIIEWASAI